VLKGPLAVPVGPRDEINTIRMFGAQVRDARGQKGESWGGDVGGQGAERIAPGSDPNTSGTNGALAMSHAARRTVLGRTRDNVFGHQCAEPSVPVIQLKRIGQPPEVWGRGRMPGRRPR